MAATDLYDSNRATLPHDQNHKHLYRSFDTSDDESTQPISHLVGQDMSVLDMGRPYRARESSLLAFQLDNLSASPDDDHRTTDFQHSLPHIVTMASAHDRGGGSNNNTEAGIDDLPPMRLGHEISNDLRNIQLTFSNQPPARERSANPLKHLIRSRHNFRALVTYGGYLFPINILLNVILLGRGWLAYPTVETDGNIHTVSNPVGYLATSVVSLVLIVCSGVCFILRCIEYDVVITTMTSIIANFVNAVLILAIAIMYLKNERPKHPGARLTGEYYCSYAGAMVALLNALLLLLDVLVTPGFRYRGSGMSRQQRLLQFNIIVVVVWIGIGGYVWSKIEDWDTITSVMFCMVSVTTIGFGNRSPTKVYSRVLILIYGPLGILMFGMMLLHTRNVIIQITKSKFSRAKRGLEARRKKIEQEATLHQVKRRLAAHPEQRSCKSVVVGFLGQTFLVVSAVSYFSDLLSRGLRRTRVQRRIEKRRRSLIAYEIRRHIKHPNYNPFSHGEEDRLVQEGITSLKRAMAHVVELFRGKRSLKNAFKRRHTADQRQRDEVLAEGFIRQATGLGGFGMTEWQPPSPPASPVTSPLGTPQPFPQSPHASPAETPSLSESPDEPRAETQALENHQPEPATGSANASPTA
ncbi:Potassium channel [Coemansia sp. RSA 2322]|nr:Potassium channel [Coemansia sp. RSA 2322]